jgi:hypothetical protein
MNYLQKLIQQAKDRDQFKNFNEALESGSLDKAWYILEKMRDALNPYYTHCFKRYHDQEKKGF